MKKTVKAFSSKDLGEGKTKQMTSLQKIQSVLPRIRGIAVKYSINRVPRQLKFPSLLQ
jgi:hypothetical protein